MQEYWVNVYESAMFHRLYYSYNKEFDADINAHHNKLLYRIHVKMKPIRHIRQEYTKIDPKNIGWVK